jgi:hypothetical protein
VEIASHLIHSFNDNLRGVLLGFAMVHQIHSSGKAMEFTAQKLRIRAVSKQYEALAIGELQSPPHSGFLEPRGVFDELVKIAGQQNSAIISTPVMTAAVEQKWAAFGFRFFSIMGIAWVCFCILYACFTFLVLERMQSGEHVMSAAEIPLTITLNIVVVLFLIAYISIEFVQLRYIGFREYAADIWNVFDWSFYLLVIGVLVVNFRDLWVDDDLDQLHKNQEDLCNMVALSFPFLGLKSLYFLRGFDATGPFIRMVFQVFHDMYTFMLVMLIIMSANFCAFYFIFNDPEELGYREFHSRYGMFYMFSMMMGNFNDKIITKNALSIVMFVTYMIFIVIVLLNLLIALMSSSYEAISSISEEQTLLEKANIILDVQMFLSEKQRKGKWFPKHMDPRSITGMINHENDASGSGAGHGTAVTERLQEHNVRSAHNWKDEAAMDRLADLERTVTESSYKLDIILEHNLKELGEQLNSLRGLVSLKRDI